MGAAEVKISSVLKRACWGLPSGSAGTFRLQTVVFTSQSQLCWGSFSTGDVSAAEAVRRGSPSPEQFFV